MIFVRCPLPSAVKTPASEKKSTADRSWVNETPFWLNTYCPFRDALLNPVLPPPPPPPLPPPPKPHPAANKRVATATKAIAARAAHVALLKKGFIRHSCAR